MSIWHAVCMSSRNHCGTAFSTSYFTYNTKRTVYIWNHTKQWAIDRHRMSEIAIIIFDGIVQKCSCDFK